MKVELVPGKYVVAVSGGVDSVVLLDLLARDPQLKLVVAHFDHGIRVDSSEDRKFVKGLSKEYGLEFVFAEGKLGANASEALAREKRYEFLKRVREERGASAIIAAHHQDDLLETAIINLMRGTNRRGLSALKSTDIIKRPLLNFSKQEIKNYALANHLAWREDSTNSSDKYLRNHIRHNILPKLDRQKLLTIVKNASSQNSEIDELLASLVPKSSELDRAWFKQLDAKIQPEILAAWLRNNGVTNYDKATIARLTEASRSAKTGTRHNFIGNRFLIVGRDRLALESYKR